VVARTYAMYVKANRANSYYDLETSVADQVYGGSDREDYRSDVAVNETAGEILTYHRQIIPAYYHSTCGGRTEAPGVVWDDPTTAVVSVKCVWCKASPRFRWSYRIARHELAERLRQRGIALDAIETINVHSRTSAGRVRELLILGAGKRALVEAVGLRAMLGYGRLRSTWFGVSANGGDFVFDGRGAGHGVGLCQWGAKGLAEKGYNYLQILRGYYPRARIERRW